MFVQIVRGKAQEYLECKRVRLKQSEDVEHIVELFLEPDGHEVHVDKRDTVVYLLNDSGKSFDYYRWHEAVSGTSAERVPMPSEELGQ